MQVSEEQFEIPSVVIPVSLSRLKKPGVVQARSMTGR